MVIKRENCAILAALAMLSAPLGAEQDERHGLQIAPPVASSLDAGPWSPRNPASMRLADGEIRRRLRELQESTGRGAAEDSVVRTRYFLVGGDLSRSERARLGTLLDGQVRRLVERFGGSIEHEPFPSRIGLFILGSRDRFELVEADRFDCYPGRALAARLHVDGEQLMLIADATAMRGRLDHQLSRAIAAAWLYGLHAPGPVPAWFEQGFMTASAWLQTSAGTGFGRRAAIDSVRSGRSLEDMLLYEAHWYDDPLNEARAGLLVERLLQQPEALRGWLIDIKGGGAWREAFRGRFGSTPEDLADHAVRWYLVND